jgi:SAM-dependent methyltransferase
MSSDDSIAALHDQADADPAIAALMREAAALSGVDTDRAAECYLEVLKRCNTHLGAHNALERMAHRRSYGAWMNIGCVIDPRDDIFHFFARNAAHGNPIREYLSDGWRTLSELLLLMDAVDRPLTRVESILEFASGFGRFTRHLAKALPGKVTCTDVLPGANDFVRAQFGVQTMESTRDPDALGKLGTPRQFELVFVLSLFTHLPPAMWGRWLKALYALVKPGGTLVFTVHNERIARGQGVEFDQQGVFFIPSSESPSIPGHVYGTTATTKAYAEAAVRDALGVAPDLFRETTFWEGQDAIVVHK